MKLTNQQNNALVPPPSQGTIVFEEREMTRYYYDNMLSVAWMAKNFGMRFSTWETRDYAVWDYGHEIHVLPFVDANKNDRWTVHPDSLPLLEPQVGDLVTNTFSGNKGRECSGLVSELTNSGKSAMIATCERHNGSRRFCESVAQLVIVQRNGKPFFWPLSE